MTSRGYDLRLPRQLRAELPDEDKTREDIIQDKVGHLRMSPCGTRDVVMSWQAEVAKRDEAQIRHRHLFRKFGLQSVSGQVFQ